ncbi:MAG: hydrogenase expression/formation protein HypE [Bacteroidetes bacterium]|nr:hydrogenase expression/formation protein HypE [Bacteroidota bacterium]
MIREKNILLSHGSGGGMSHELIRDLFVRYFDNEILRSQTDSAILDTGGSSLAFTTDSYVVDPVFFPGGNIGKLSVCGTVNDLAVSGATPLYISCGFIIEEGFPVKDLETIVASMAEEAGKAGVLVVTGDTKVVNRGKCDKLFINTSGIGVIGEERKDIGTGAFVRAGDRILINGTIGDHGIAIMGTRNELSFSSDIKSDCACLNRMIGKILDAGVDVRFMRDATRGGLATVLCELASSVGLGITIDEKAVQVKESVRGMCEVFGFDPMHVANEGKVVMVVTAGDAQKALEMLRSHELGKDASIIGEITEKHTSRVILQTEIGGSRIIDMLAGEQLPRIC